MIVDEPALGLVRDYLDAMLYPLVDRRLSWELGPSLTGFPRFEPLRRAVERLSPTDQVLFRLLRLGLAVDDSSLRSVVPGNVIEALHATGLVDRTPGGEWQTNGLLVIPAENLVLITGSPPSYPAAPPRPSAVFDLSTLVVAAMLPSSLAGLRALDIGSGTGIQALLCAVRGATEVLGLEVRATAVAIARANAVLNGLQDRVRFRQSDLLSGLREDERFDFVVGNLPWAPVVGDGRCPDTVAGIGTSVLWPLLDALPAHLSGSACGVLAAWRAAGFAGRTYQAESVAARMAAAGCAVSAYVDPTFDTVDGVLDSVSDDLIGRCEYPPAAAASLVARIRPLIEESPLPVDGFYNQFIRFSRCSGEPAGPVLRGPTRIPSPGSRPGAWPLTRASRVAAGR